MRLKRVVTIVVVLALSACGAAPKKHPEAHSELSRADTMIMELNREISTTARYTSFLKKLIEPAELFAKDGQRPTVGINGKKVSLDEARAILTNANDYIRMTREVRDKLRDKRDALYRDVLYDELENDDEASIRRATSELVEAMGEYN